ncbi:type II toxin-antitoxin system HicB family antitoxin [Loigolactobacillus binensis]|uniref:Type II toxin-antitoxin system HicB family antitoxin n=1 Tax=Loigolactobacillus binensis TaxID=2559922 RepID=A0ABW3EEC0_9LACO|nr:type II toxin-antitoxin system HicB family antitoxin [Loigolactobacillus binensis]
MSKNILVYPVILSKDGDYIFVQVPDIAGGFTQGNDLKDAIVMAEDLIGNLLADVSVYPKASAPADIKLATDEQLVYVSVDIDAFRRKYGKLVRKNITIPEYLNRLAKDQKINVSQVATAALKVKLGI